MYSSKNEAEMILKIIQNQQDYRGGIRPYDTLKTSTSTIFLFYNNIIVCHL